MERKDLIIVGLCFVLLFVWMFKVAPSMATKPAPATVPAEVVPGTPTGGEGATGGETGTAPVAGQPPPSTPGTGTGDEPATGTGTPPMAISTGPLAEEYLALPANEPVVLRGGEAVDFVVAPDLGGVTQVLMHNYKNQAHEPTMPLLARGATVLALRDRGGHWQFSPAKILAKNERSLTISRWIKGTTLVLEQRWALDAEHAYRLDYEARLRNLGGELASVPSLAVDAGLLEPLDAPAGFFGAAGIDQSLAVRPLGKRDPESLPVAKIIKLDAEDTQVASALPIQWLAVQNKYFTSLLIAPAEQSFPGYQASAPPALDAVGTPLPNRHLIGGALYLNSLPLAPGESRAWELSAYLGPKNYSMLKEQGGRLEGIMAFDLFLFWHFDWMEAISRLILWSVLKLHDQFNSYGLAIIIITLILRTIFWPLTHQSTVLSRKMQKLQPLAAEVREKYKSDPQKMQAKTMELYRTHKVNPITGCLPMLLQIPVFFALFNVLRSSIELRQAQWLWVYDLSIPDTIFTLPWINLPINPLAFTMGAGMILQQKLMPTSADPMQQKMMTFMSVFFVFMCYTMPSGLTLYWTVNQICSIVQYKITHVMLDRREAAAGMPATKKT